MAMSDSCMLRSMPVSVKKDGVLHCLRVDSQFLSHATMSGHRAHVRLYCSAPSAQRRFAGLEWLQPTIFSRYLPAMALSVSWNSYAAAVPVSVMHIHVATLTSGLNSHSQFFPCATFRFEIERKLPSTPEEIRSFSRSNMSSSSILVEHHQFCESLTLHCTPAAFPPFFPGKLLHFLAAISNDKVILQN